MSRSWLLLGLCLALGCDDDGGGLAGGGGADARQPDARLPDAGPSGRSWSAEKRYTLTINDDPPAPVELSLDRDEVEQLLGPAADDLVLLELDAAPFLTNALDDSKAACGDAWQADSADPQHDCDLTALGRTFSGRDGTWRTSAEYSLVRLLTMTPANAVVEGTSIEFLQLVADQFGIGGGFAQILSDTLEIARNEEFLTTDVVAASIRENLLETHPNINTGGRIEVTLRDALSDMATLAARLGRVGEHPGILDPDAGTFGPVFGPDFEMFVRADSNVRVLDGVDLSFDTKEYLTTLVDTTGPTFDDPLEFNFADEDDFRLRGLVDQPTIDLRFFVREADTFVESCTGDPPCQANLPERPQAGRTVWRRQPWQLEYIIGWAGLAKYQDLRSYNCYVPCAASEVAIGQGDDPAGWAHFGVPLELGPADQYVWELINEVAQVGLHDTGFAEFEEGDANVAFDLRGVDVGISGEEAAERVRPFMQAQAAELADFLLGDYRANSGRVDFYYRRGSDGTPALFFVAPTDLHSDFTYTWTTPGFFEDADLTRKVSALELAGFDDTAHEKWVPTPGEVTLFVEDDDGGVYRLRIVGPVAVDPTIDVFVSHEVKP